jgi:hypothetical protein
MAGLATLFLIFLSRDKNCLAIAGCSIPVVRALRVREDRVQFPASRPSVIKVTEGDENI